MDEWERLEREAEAGGMVEAANLFDYVNRHAPQLRALVKAARVAAAVGEYDGAIRDLQAALKELDEVGHAT